MITPYIIYFVHQHPALFGWTMLALLFLGLVQYIILLNAIPLTISGLLSLLITVLVALMEKNKMGFLYNYVIDLEKVFYWTNDVVYFVSFITIIIVVLLKKKKEKK